MNFKNFLHQMELNTVILPFHPLLNEQAVMCKLKNYLKKLDKWQKHCQFYDFCQKIIPSSVADKSSTELMFRSLVQTALHLILLSKPKIQQILYKYNLHELCC